MQLRNWILSLAAALALAMPALAEPPAQAFDIKTSPADVKYITGGVGDQEQARMEQRFAGYSFKLVNVRARPDAAYVSNVQATISNQDGETVVQTTTDGPWLYADLEPGEYELRASFDNQEHERSFNISQGGHERLVLDWNTSEN